MSNPTRPCLKSRLLSMLLLASIVVATPSTLSAAPKFSPKTYSDEESFQVRKIVEFWKDGDHDIVQNQINHFFSNFSDSEFNQYFHWILGDIFLENSNYEAALEQYQKISHPGLKEQMLANELQCYYQLEQYEALYQVAKPYLADSDLGQHHDEVHLFAAEALYNQALVADSIESTQLLAREARNLYAKIDQKHYLDQAGFALARIHSLLGEYEAAAQAFSQLAATKPSLSEDLLFEAATCQVEYNEEAALKTFLQIQAKKNGRFSEASYNILVILFQKGAYSDVVTNFNTHKQDLNAETVNQLQLILGKSYFALEDYTASSTCLERYMKHEKHPSEALKNALLTQMNNANYTNDQELYEQSFARFDSLFPGDAQTPKALFIQALMYKEQQKKEPAFEKLCSIRALYPEFAKDKAFIFEYALLALETEDYNESYAAIGQYIATAQTQEEGQLAAKILLSDALYLHNTAEHHPEYTANAYFDDLCFVLEHKQNFTKEEDHYFSLIFAKALFNQKRYEETIYYLNDNLLSHDEGVETQLLAKAHFLEGRSFLEGKNDPEASNYHLQKALELDDKQPGALEIKLQVYNNYLALAEHSEPETQEALLDEAANNLFSVISEAPEKVSGDNTLWMANHYFAKKDRIPLQDQEQLNQVLSRAEVCFSHLLKKEGTYVEITSETLFLEPEMLKYAKVLQTSQKLSEKRALIETLVAMQSVSGDLEWSYKNEALYELAQTYKAMGEIDKAVQTFSALAEADQGFSSTVAAKALFETTKIKFESLSKKARSKKSPEMISLLENLKTLQIRKNPFSEPVHLESALEYAQIRTELAKPEEQVDQYLFFLSRLVEDYRNVEEDLNTKAYHLGLAQDAKQLAIYENYMSFVEAERVRVKGLLHKEANEQALYEESFNHARELLEAIGSHKQCNEELKKRVAVSLELLKKDLAQ